MEANEGTVEVAAKAAASEAELEVTEIQDDALYENDFHSDIEAAAMYYLHAAGRAHHMRHEVRPRTDRTRWFG